MKMLGKYSEKQIKWGLNIIPDAYGKTKGQMRSNIIRVMVEFVKLHPDVDRCV